MELIECAYQGCSEMFKPRKITHKYCSFICKSRAFESSAYAFTTRTCERCGEPFRARERSCGTTCLTCTPNIVERICEWCGEPFLIKGYKLNQSPCKYCSRQHSSFGRYGLIQYYPEKEKIVWNSKISWLVGIIATDGNLNKHQKKISISSKNHYFLEILQEVICYELTGRKYKIAHCPKGELMVYSITFTSETFYNFCLDVGITPNKSKTISELKVPKAFFNDFLRGVVDGDGNIGIQNRTGLKGRQLCRIRISSASILFLNWIHINCKELYKVQGGNVGPGNNVNELYFAHYDSLEIIRHIYQDESISLPRKKEVALRLIKEWKDIKRPQRIRVDKTCIEPNCNNTFTVAPSQKNKNYCEEHTGYQARKVKRICLWCGEPFYVIKSIANRGHGKFCKKEHLLKHNAVRLSQNYGAVSKL